ncbi:hypothetical protein BO221_19730 [Archangium sp. Cb G35]|uniref:hypothetical protein n=1 Tax=Archangium sp. Cb G35 TaxID=1920190 RepID=UPI000937B8D9|nr:hypothetical protein [Archangium sp. Cb G35]OJT23111.1 hypothetical protein BO221_19730 [Archangium sp. Cb G35]
MRSAVLALALGSAGCIVGEPPGNTGDVADSGTSGLPDSGTSGLPDSGTPDVPDSGTSGVPDSGTPPPGTFSCPTARSTVDRADSTTDYKVKFLYVLPSDEVDRSLDINGAICRSVQAQNTWFTSQTTNGAGFRYDLSSSVLDIQFVRLSKTDAQMKGTDTTGDINTGHAYVRDRIERELTAMGVINDTRKLYAVYYGGTSEWACGGATWPPVIIGKVVALYLNGLPSSPVPCASNPVGNSSTVPGYIEYAMLHEMVHGLGFVPDAAPNEHSSGHVYALARDLMYSPRPGTSDPYWDIYSPLGVVLDSGRDQYYGHGGSQLDLADSAFLQPLPAGAAAPPGW